MQAAPSATSMSKARPAAGLPVIPEVPSEPPQTVPMTSSSDAHRHRRRRIERRALLGHERPALGDRRPRPARRLDDDGLHRPPALADRLREPVLVEALAAERDQQHRADVGMRAEPLHHRLGVAVRIAAGKADDVHVAVAERDRDLAGDMVRALDQVADDDRVADALAPVGPQIALHHDALPVRRPRRLEMIGRRIVALHVVDVDVLARGDRRRRRSDRRAVLHHLLAGTRSRAAPACARAADPPPPSPARRRRRSSRRRGSAPCTTRTLSRASSSSSLGSVPASHLRHRRRPSPDRRLQSVPKSRREHPQQKEFSILSHLSAARG